MQWDVERWLTGRKYLFMISVALVLIAVIGFWLLLPLQAETSAGRSPQVQAQWRKLLPLSSALQTAGMAEDATRFLRLLIFLLPGRRLSPGGQGAPQARCSWRLTGKRCPRSFPGWLAAGCALRLSPCSRKSRRYG